MILLSLLSLAISLLVALGLLYQGQELKRLREALTDQRRTAIESKATEPLPEPSILESLRIGLTITQDHDRPTFELLLKERLMEEGAQLVNPNENPDIVIEGKLLCNGYAEIYFEADLTCQTKTGPLTTINEKPPQGGRQLSLATELIARLKRDLESTLSRQERLRALSEMGLTHNLQ